MRYRRNNNRSPRFMNAKFAGKCAETGAEIKAGDPILYADGKAYCEDSNRYKDFQSAEFDRIVLGREY